MKLFIGYDPIERAAFRALMRSVADYKVEVEPLVEAKLRAQGLYTRLTDKRGQYYDIVSNAPCSTEFSTSRFLTPILAQQGWALFVDCDVVFLCDPQEIMRFVDPSKAVMVVKHKIQGNVDPKMGGMAQTRYARKNWSSVMLFNCNHPANLRLSLRDVNERPGRDLHAFYWLNDDEVGELPKAYNWLVNVEPKPKDPKIAHFTLGGPWIDGWEPAEHDEVWYEFGNKI